jgi:hypothetical protein
MSSDVLHCRKSINDRIPRMSVLRKISVSFCLLQNVGNKSLTFKSPCSGPIYIKQWEWCMKSEKVKTSNGLISRQYSGTLFYTLRRLLCMVYVRMMDVNILRYFSDRPWISKNGDLNSNFRFHIETHRNTRTYTHALNCTQYSPQYISTSIKNHK